MFGSLRMDSSSREWSDAAIRDKGIAPAIAEKRTAANGRSKADESMREDPNKAKYSQPEIIIGIDPGTRITGYGIIGLNGNKYKAIDYGCITPPSTAKLTERYLILFNALENLLNRYAPNVLAVETQYVGKNVQSALKLGQARGIAMVVAKRMGISVYEYSPTSVKKAVGSGKASKVQVQELVKMVLGLSVIPEPYDAADALAIALCHANAASYFKISDWEI